MILSISLTILIISIIVVVFNYKENKTALYLSGFLFIYSLSWLLHYYFFCINSVIKQTLLYEHFITLFYLCGPMLYFYIRGTLKNKTNLSNWDFLHFLPFIISLFSIFPSYHDYLNINSKASIIIIKTSNYKSEYAVDWLYHLQNNTLIRLLILVIYAIGCLVLLFENVIQNITHKANDKSNLIKLYWLFSLTITIFICSASYLIMVYQCLKGDSSTITELNKLNISYVSLISYGLIPIILLIFPQVIYGLPLLKIEEIRQKADNYFENESTVTKTIVKKTTQKEENKTENYEVMLKTILEHLKTNKPFTDPNYNLNSLSQELNIEKCELNNCFNNYLKKRFSLIRTEFRVDYAKECLINGDLEPLSMEGIWTKAGFSSKTSFFVSFKEVTGVSPLEFSKMNLKKDKKTE